MAEDTQRRGGRADPSAPPRAPRDGPLVPALAAACHPGPTVAVTVLGTLLAVAVRRRPARRRPADAGLPRRTALDRLVQRLGRRRPRRRGRPRRQAGRAAARWTGGTVGRAALAAAVLTAAPVVLARAACRRRRTWSPSARAGSTTWGSRRPCGPGRRTPCASACCPPSSPCRCRAARGPASWAMAAGALLGVGAHLANVLPDLEDDRRHRHPRAAAPAGPDRARPASPAWCCCWRRRSWCSPRPGARAPVGWAALAVATAARPGRHAGGPADHGQPAAVPADDRRRGGRRGAAAVLRREPAGLSRLVRRPARRAPGAAGSRAAAERLERLSREGPRPGTWRSSRRSARPARAPGRARRASRNSLGMPCRCTGTSSPAVAQRDRHRPRRCRRTTRLSSTTATAPGRAGRLDEVVADRQDPPRVDDADACGPAPASFSATATAVDGHRADPDEQQVDRVGRRRSCEDVEAAPPLERGDRRRRRRPWGSAAPSGRRRRRRPRAAAGATCSPSRGAASRSPGTIEPMRHVPHAVVRGAVAAGDAGAVEHEGHAGPVQRAVHQQLVEGPVEEGGVDGDDRVQPAERQAGGHRHRVLLGDADVEDAVGEARGEAVEPDGDQHGRGDGDDVGALARRSRTSSSLNSSVQMRPPDLERQPGLGVDHADGVELVGLVVAGRVRSRGPSG